MSKINLKYLQGIRGRDADIDLVVAEFVSERAGMKARIKAMTAENEALKRKIDGQHRKIIDMQTVLDVYILKYESDDSR